MKEKILSILFWRFNFPSVLEIRVILRSFVLWEKVTLLIVSGVIMVGVFGVWFELQERFAVTIASAGGSFREGIVGTPHLANPILASTEADRDLVQLLYAGLMKSDGHGKLEKNLARNLEISEDGLSYTFTLKDGLIWHDGEPLTSEDIAFTIQAAKNPAIKSPLRANWEGVETEVVNEKTIRFWLKKPYAPFLENTTLGILPKHIWKNATTEQFSLSEFNRRVIGSGPYKIKEIRRSSAGIITSYVLKAFNNYASGKPLIPKIELKFYNSENELLTAFEKGDVNAVSFISANNIPKIDFSEEKLKTLTLPRIFGVFFNQNRSEILQDKDVRKALNQAVNKADLVETVLSGYGIPLNSAVPPNIIEYDTLFKPEHFSLSDAADTLDAAGWKLNLESGIREKKNLSAQAGRKEPAIELGFSIATADTPELVMVAELLRSIWQTLGVKVSIKIFEIGDLNQNIIRPREYEALLFGEIIGRDPDPFAFWHSSQRNDPGLNIALYANKNVDRLLEEARTITNAQERNDKYVEFLQEIEKDVPAVFLYSPYYLYIAPSTLKGFNTSIITIPAERFANIHQWHLYTQRVWKIFIQ